MVQDHESTVSSIPEELYNLTQLAEVTLAAGKLSTTNISEITEYINNKEKIKEENFETIIDKPENLLDNIKSKKIRRKFTTPQENSCNTDNIIEIDNKINENIEKIDNFLIVKPIPFNPIKNNLQQNIKMKNLNENNVNFFSSSDDDSNYYSHKIFDRKKSRRSTFSDNSTIRLDELSCSSFPSSCDEMNYSTLSGSSSAGGTNTINGIDDNSIKIIRESSNILFDDEHICPECGKKYSTSSNLARHRQTHRSILDKKARRCPYCEKVYVSMPAYSMHVRTHNQGCKCDHCGKCFSRPWLLQGHIRTHTGEKPFKCATCNKAFADKSNLRAHIQTHSNTKPHACIRCGKSFALKSYLYKHEESSCMRNRIKHDKDRTTSTSSSSPSATSLKMTVTKSTLASKILQRESQALKDLQQLQNLNSITSQQNNQQNEQFSEILPNTTKNISWEYERRDFGQLENISSSENEQNNGKSYTTLTSPMSQEEYDRFARISVIRPPISSTTNYIDHHHHQIQPQNTNNLQMNFYQENPVDFSPKNNFTHSTKTSPFELTSSYAMVA